METVLPPPMTPPDCDLRGYGFMPLFGTRLFGSRFYSLARRHPRAGLAGMKLWWEAWTQCPAGSLPDDDFDLCHLAGFGDDLEAWRAARETALHGFVKCSDGRLYHPFLADEAISAFEMRIKADKRRGADRERLRTWREEHKMRGGTGLQKRALDDATKADETPSETRFETRVETRAETRFETPCVARDRTETVQDKENVYIPTSQAAGAKKSPPRRSAAGAWDADADFVAFYDAYPRKVAPDGAYKAWRKVMTTVRSPATIMAGLRRYQFQADQKFNPLPAKWLTDGYWRSAEGEAPPGSPAAARPIKTASGYTPTEEELFQVLT